MVDKSDQWERDDGLDPAVPTYGELSIPSSMLARELSKLPVGVRQQLAASDTALSLVDAAVDFCHRVSGVTDDHWTKHLGDVVTAFDGRMTPDDRQWLFDVFTSETQLREYASRFARQNFLQFAEKLLGAGTYYRLRLGVQQDLTVVVSVLLRVTEYMQPLVGSLLQMLNAMPEADLRWMAEENITAVSLIRGLVGAAAALDSIVEAVDLPREILEGPQVLRFAPSASDADLLDLALTFDRLVSGRSAELLRDLGTSLSRKIRGARDALANSADANSQAANSLIEFVDRLLRAANSDEEVLVWLDSNNLSRGEYTYQRSDQTLPTIRAKALCFAYAAGPVAEGHPTPFHAAAALTLADARKKLQAIKHNDQGTPEEAEAIRAHLTAIEAYLAFAGTMWWLLPTDRLADLQLRLQ